MVLCACPCAFAQNENLSYTITNGVLEIKCSGVMPDFESDSAAPWHEKAQEITEIIISEGVTAIGSCAFCNLYNVTEIQLATSLEKIGDCAFVGCSALKSITLPPSVKTVGNQAFYDCCDIESVNISSLESFCSIDFAASSANPLLYGARLYLNNTPCENIDIPQSISTLKCYAFAGCSGLKSVSSKTLTEIGEGAFCGCVSLESASFESCEKIERTAFDGCSALKSIILSNNLKSVGDYAFSGCEQLKSINLPRSVTTLGTDIFEGCESVCAYCPRFSYSFNYCKQNGVKTESNYYFIIIPALLITALAAALLLKNKAKLLTLLTARKKYGKI